eukprot:TRINITY_DN95033_c0_g1_i1.p1 TRINITY_DN95033_c0_g1~~TRINITY_DN95033_c0_g1_i1.p1  ORF type:complete len:357 (+),score=58.92 TRINITY_DN95033_c0_g1_i1:55-1125(+)
MALDHRKEEGFQPSIYSDLLSQQSDTIHQIRSHVEAVVSQLEERRELCTAKRLLMNVFKKDVQESFAECRSTVKKSISSMINYLKQQQEEMLRELDTTLQGNVENLQVASSRVEKSLHQIESQIEEGRTLLREPDMFTFFAKGSLFRQLPVASPPTLNLEFRDTFPDLTTLSIQPYQVPLQHAVQVDMRGFLSSGVQTRICGNIFHNGFRFQIQLKHDDRYLSAYLCLRAWHDVAAFLRVTVNFTLTLQDGPELIHTATAKNTFEGPNDGWGWNKFVPLNKLADCTDVLFIVSFNELQYHFIQEDELEMSHHQQGGQPQLPPPQHPPGQAVGHMAPDMHHGHHPHGGGGYEHHQPM